MPGVRAVGHGPRIGLDVKANGTERRQMAKKKKKIARGRRPPPQTTVTSSRPCDVNGVEE